MTLLEIDSRRHHSEVARELVVQALQFYATASAYIIENRPGEALRQVLEGDMKISRAMENLNEVSE